MERILNRLESMAKHCDLSDRRIRDSVSQRSALAGAVIALGVSNGSQGVLNAVTRASAANNVIIRDTMKFMDSVFGAPHGSHDAKLIKALGKQNMLQTLFKAGADGVVVVGISIDIIQLANADNYQDAIGSGSSALLGALALAIPSASTGIGAAAAGAIIMSSIIDDWSARSKDRARRRDSEATCERMIQGFNKDVENAINACGI